jgi:hypothetical protein
MRNHVLEVTAVSAALTAALTLFATRAGAVTTEAFVLDDAADFAGGELDGAAIESTGRVVPGVTLERLGLPGAATAYSMARGADGTVYVGTGNEGKVYAVRGGRAELHAETGQLLVSSLAVGAGGVLYAGTLPEGRIFAIESRGTVRELARPEGAEHVFALLWDGTRLFAGTGPTARVYAITPEGDASIYYDGGPGHVMSLARGEDGSLFAGTDGRALLLRLRGAGQAEVVHDFPGNEVTAVAIRDGILAVAANEFPEPAAGATRTPTAGKVGKGRLFRVARDGDAELLAERDDGHFTAVQIDQDGSFLAATGEGGRVVRASPDHAQAVLVDVEERQILAMDLLGSPGVLVTGDGAAVYRVAARNAREGTWTSKALDARFVARFGRIAFRGEGPIEISTRSGNSETADATWSEWSAPLRSAGPIRSPAARFLQIRAKVGRGASLRAITAYYLPRNQRAVVTAVGLKSGAARQGGRPGAPSSQYELEWQVANPDGDPLRYTVRFRNEAGGPFRELVGDDDALTEARYRWDTSSVADGFYVVEVTASDAGANAAVLALEHSARSEPILVDNHPPVLDGLRVRAGRVEGRAIDGLGPVARLELAIDGGPFREALPSDHLLDTREERFAIPLPSSLGPGEHIVAVRATDAAGNAVTAETVARVAARR